VVDLYNQQVYVVLSALQSQMPVQSTFHPHCRACSVLPCRNLAIWATNEAELVRRAVDAFLWDKDSGHYLAANLTVAAGGFELVVRRTSRFYPWDSLELTIKLCADE